MHTIKARASEYVLYSRLHFSSTLYQENEFLFVYINKLVNLFILCVVIKVISKFS